jgi:hypothetical protein
LATTEDEFKNLFGEVCTLFAFNWTCLIFSPQFGTVHAIRLLKKPDGMPQGVGFVEFTDEVSLFVFKDIMYILINVGFLVGC